MIHNRALLVLLLGLSVFAAITTEMGVIGVLPQLADAFEVPPATAGILVSTYALVVAVTGPIVTLFTARINRKAVLLVILTILTVSNMMYAVSGHMGLTLIFRVIPAAVHASLFATAIAVAVQMSKPEHKTRASGQVFAGVAIGLVLGVPITAFVADTYSLAAAFAFGALSSAVALVGIALFMPSMPIAGKLSYGEQLQLLREGRVWWNLAGVTLIFAGMFSVYSYFAEYLQQVTHLSPGATSGLLMLFGAAGIVGNWLMGRLLERCQVRTAVLYPVAFLFVYLLVHILSGNALAITALIVVWGAAHSGGLIVSQTWLSRETGAAPEFGNSLYISFSNVGITAGASLAGFTISWLGSGQLVLSGLVFLVAAIVVMGTKAVFDRRALKGRTDQPERISVDALV